MEIKTIPIEKITENEWNTNIMVDSTLDHLKAEYKRIGYLQPILVRPKGNGFEVIDGAHRLRVAKELSFAEVDCVVKEMSDKEAKVTSLNMNKIKGENDPIKLAELLKDLKSSFSIEELSELIKMSENELDSFDLLLDLPDSLDEDFEETTKTGINYSFKLTPTQDEVFIKALRYTKIQNNLTAAFMSIVEDYIYYIEHKDAKV